MSECDHRGPRPLEHRADEADAGLPPVSYAELLSAIPVDLAVFDADGRYRYLNARSVADPELRRWLIGRTELDYCRRRNIDTSMAERRMRWFAEARGSRQAREFEEVIETSRGQRHFLRRLVPIFDREGALRWVIGFGLDVTERRQVEAAAHTSETRYRQLFEQIGDAVYISSPEGRLLDLNQAGLKMLGFGHVAELSGIDLERDVYVDPWERQELQRRMARDGYVRDLELRLKTSQGQPITVSCTTTSVHDADGTITAYLGILRDVTDRRKLEDQLRQSKKMEAVGRLAGGLAHDFNNALTAINGYCDLMLLQVEKDTPMREYLEEIRDAGRRAAQLTSQLLVLSRRAPVAPRPVDLNRVVDGLDMLLQRMVGEHNRLHIQLAHDLPPVRVDASQIEQALLNLALNARDAMPSGGDLRISTRAVVLGETEATPLDLAPGRFVSLEVADTGIGIDPDAREHIFEPFFTTKDAAGAGLGLTTVYATVRQAGGQIEVDSSREGTTFRVLLPTMAEDEGITETRPEDQPAQGTLRGDETILLVEDEPSVRLLVRTLLRRQGYRLIEAPSAEDALETVEREQIEIDLLLSDVVMPGLSGPELAQQLLEKRPTLRILFMTGYSDNLTIQHGLHTGEPQVLTKPFAPRTLLGAVREILDR